MIPEGGDDIVLSGSGIIVCLGETTDTVWRAVTRGECGVGALTAMERGHAPELRGGQAVEIDAESGSGDSREIVYLRRAIRDSLVSAGLAADGNGGFLLPCPGSRLRYRGWDHAPWNAVSGRIPPLRKVRAAQAISACGGAPSSRKRPWTFRPRTHHLLSMLLQPWQYRLGVHVARHWTGRLGRRRRLRPCQRICLCGFQQPAPCVTQTAAPFLARSEGDERWRRIRHCCDGACPRRATLRRPAAGAGRWIRGVG